MKRKTILVTYSYYILLIHCLLGAPRTYLYVPISLSLLMMFPPAKMPFLHSYLLKQVQLKYCLLWEHSQVSRQDEFFLLCALRIP